MTPPLLSICLFIYNRKDLVLNNIATIMECNDPRVQVIVQDNASTDGIEEALAALNNPRVIYRRNETNIGPIANQLRSLSNVNSDYVIAKIDKDSIHSEHLSEFLDFLERERPVFGYVAPWSTFKDLNSIRHKAGSDAISNLGFQCTHPTGYFFRTSEWDRILRTDWFNRMPRSHDFAIDLVAGYLAMRHDGYFVDIALFTPHYKKLESAKIKSTYNANNFFFAPHKCIKTMKYYLFATSNSAADSESKVAAARVILYRALWIQTILAKRLHKDRYHIEHYNLPEKDITFLDMQMRIFSVCRAFASLSTDVISRTKAKKLIWSQFIRINKEIIGPMIRPRVQPAIKMAKILLKPLKY